MAEPQDRPDFETAATKAMKARATFIRDMRAGTTGLRSKPGDYLPKFEGESVDDWHARANMTFAFDAVDVAIGAMVGLALKGGIGLENDVPQPIRDIAENIDGEGAHIEVFAQRVLDDALTDGHAGILTDFPHVVTEPGATRTAADDAALRPYLVKVQMADIGPPRIALIDGKPTLTQLVIRQTTEEPFGDFGSAMVTRYRRYMLTDQGPGFEVLIESKSKTSNQSQFATEVPFTLIRGPNRIPFAPVYGGQQTGFLTSLPPQEGLAFSQLMHAQIGSDRRVSEHKTSVPTPAITGLSDKMLGPDGTLVLGGSAAILLDPGGDAKYMEISGNGLESLRLHQEDVERRMAAQSLSMMQREEGQAATATAHKLTEGQRQSKLWRASRSLQDAMEASFQFMAEFLGLPSGGSVVIKRDFGALIDLPTLTLLSNDVEKGNLSLGTYLKFLTEALELGIDPEAENELLRREQEDPVPLFPPAGGGQLEEAA